MTIMNGHSLLIFILSFKGSIPPNAVSSCSVFLFMQFRTLLHDEDFPTPFPSITSALFPMQRRGRGTRQCPNLHSSVYSSKFRILQLLCFHTLHKTAGVGVYSSQIGTPSMFHLQTFKRSNVSPPVVHSTYQICPRTRL